MFNKTISMMNESQINSFSILFWGQKTRKNKLGEIPIYMRITVDGKRAELSTNRFIEESSWNAKAQTGAFRMDRN